MCVFLTHCIFSTLHSVVMALVDFIISFKVENKSHFTMLFEDMFFICCCRSDTCQHNFEHFIPQCSEFPSLKQSAVAKSASMVARHCTKLESKLCS